MMMTKMLTTMMMIMTDHDKNLGYVNHDNGNDSNIDDDSAVLAVIQCGTGDNNQIVAAGVSIKRRGTSARITGAENGTFAELPRRGAAESAGNEQT